MVDTGKIQAEIALFAEMDIPQINKELVGRDIQVTLMRGDGPVGTRMKRWTYEATVLSVNLHDIKGRKKLPSARVRWHEEDEEVGTVFLDLDMYHEMDQKFGWCLVHDDDESEPQAAVEAIVAEYEQKTLEHECLIPQLMA